MESIESKYEWTTINDSIREKDWAAGSRAQITQTDFTVSIIGGKPIGRLNSIKYSPALWKIIDETLVNALDHKIRCENKPCKVTYIKVELTVNGRITITNDGPGVETAIHRVATEKLGEEIRVPTLIFGTPLQGSNRKDDPSTIIGGTNGLGAKIGNIFSSEFIVETVSDTDYFRQRWSNLMNSRDKPVVIPLNDPRIGKLGARAKPHTTLSFTPDYSLFGYIQFDDVEYEILAGLIRARVIFASVYAEIPVYFNNEKYKCDVSDLAKIFYDGLTTVTTKITPSANPKAPYHTYPWDICAVIGPGGCVGNANSIMLKEGRHYAFLKDRLCAGITVEMAKILKDKDASIGPSVVNNNVFLFVNAKIPGAHWTGQRKDVLEIDRKYLKGYEFDKKFITTITTHLKSQLASNVAKRAKKTKFDYDKIRSAKYAAKKNHKNYMMLAEGDSAFTQIVIGASVHLGWDHYGLMCLSGVIINVRKECTITRVNGIKYLKKKTKMNDNIFWNVFLNEIGLKESYDYDPKSLTYAAEIAELRYDGIIVCVDQDLDGKGKILSLLIGAFEYIWPDLISRGFIQWWCSPIIRAYPKKGGAVAEFYAVKDFETWKEDRTKYDITYYKGLATHSRDETIQMFSTFKDHLYTYYLDDNSRELFNIYLGPTPALRKIELSKEPPVPTADELAAIESTRKISCSYHLKNEADPFQRDDIDRKLSCVNDGFNQSGRKIANGILNGKLDNGKPIKVSQLAGYISEHGNYHHGEVGLGDSIAGRAFVATGGRQVPLLVPKSQFGSRLGGGDDRGAARYIWCKLNKPVTDLLFPKDDYGLLEFHFDEGKRCEPIYFMPIIPFAVLETTVMPSHGWKFQTWARDVFKVIDAVRLMIKFGPDINLTTPPPAIYINCPYEWRGEFRMIGGKQHSVGRYEYSSSTNTLVITELPLRVWTNKYVLWLKQIAADDSTIIDGVKNIDDRSDDINVRIIIKLANNAINLLESRGTSSTDGVEEYFRLHEFMETHLNFTCDEKVIKFDNYVDIMKMWFVRRREYYERRVKRKTECLKLDVLRLEQIIKYIRARYKFSDMKENEMISALTKDGFVKLEVTKISNPKFVIDVTERVLNGPKSTYGYLLNLSDLRKSSESLAKFEQELAAARNNLSDYVNLAGEGTFHGASIWQQELTKLEANLREGMRTYWQYEEFGKFKYGSK